MILPSSAWEKLRFSQAFPVILGSLALLLLAKAPGKLAETPAPDLPPDREATEDPDGPAGPPSGAAGNEAPDDTGDPTRVCLTSELPSRGGPHGVRAEKVGTGAAIISDHRDPTFDRFRSGWSSSDGDGIPSRAASPFAARAPPSPADIVEIAG